MYLTFHYQENAENGSFENLEYMITLKTRNELAYAYGYWCTPTFKRHLKKKGIILPRYGLLDANIQLTIYAKMGIPSGLSLEEQATIATLLENYSPEVDLPPHIMKS
jgi:hypothetical protein